MRQKSDYISDNPDTQGRARILGAVIRHMPFSRLIALLPSGEPMVKIASGRNEALIPLSLAKRVVHDASPSSFARSDRNVRMDGGELLDLLDRIECERMPLRMRYAVVEASTVAWAATMHTFVGDVTIEADAATVELARAKGKENGFAAADANLVVSRLAAASSGRTLSRAA